MYGWYVGYLLRLQRVKGRLDGHVLLAVDLYALTGDLLWLGLVAEGVDDDFEFVGGKLSRTVWSAQRIILVLFCTIHHLPCGLYTARAL